MREKAEYSTYKLLCIISGCGGGDWPPLLALAEWSMQNGHDVVVVCDNSTKNSVRAAQLNTLCLPGSLDFAKGFNPVMARLLLGHAKFEEIKENPFVTWGSSCVDSIMRSLKGWRPDIIITSLFGIGLGDLLAREFSVPRCFLNPAFNFEYPEGQFRYSDFSEIGGQMYEHWLFPLAKTADLILHATDQGFDIAKERHPPHHAYVGPLFWEEPMGKSDRFDDAGLPWVLITLSTSPQFGDLAIVTAALEALKALDVRVLVTLAPEHDLDLLGNIPVNVHLTRYYPHSQVLSQCILVISHAGHGSVMKAMIHGIPMVLVPWGRDQPGVAIRAKRLGVATVVPKSQCNGDTVAKAIRQAVEEPQFKENAQILSNRLGKSNNLVKAIGHITSFLENSN